MIDIAIKLSELPPGRTNEQYLKSIGWSDFNMIYQNAVNKLTHKILNNQSNDKHFLYSKLTQNRSIRAIADNTTGPKPKVEQSDLYTLKTFSFNVRNYYSKLNRKLTTIPSPHLFKSWLKKCNNNEKNTDKLKIYPDHKPTLYLSNLTNEICNTMD